MRMLKRFTWVTAVLTAIVGSALASGPAAVIEPGLPAPAMSVKNWYKGDHVTSFAADKTYVVEFWATWCGPCKQSIPHLSEIAKANPDVTFVGVSIWEDDKDGNIQKFVQDMGDKMSYNVGYSGNKDGMAQTWMDAAGQNGIPCAFIVKNGNIQWVGHPMTIDEPLAQVKAGTFDVAAFRTQFDEKAAKTRADMAINLEIGDIAKTFDGGDHAGAKAKLDDFVTKHPERQSSADTMKFGWLSREDVSAWKAKATEMAQSNDKKKQQMLLGFALRQGSPKGNHELGKTAIDLMMKATGGKDMLTLQYSVAFYQETKDYQNALTATNAILALLPTSKLKDNAEFKDAMIKQKADFEAKLKG